MEEEVEPVSVACVDKHGAELDKLHEEGVENPEESEENPVGVVVIKEVDDEGL